MEEQFDYRARQSAWDPYLNRAEEQQSTKARILFHDMTQQFGPAHALRESGRLFSNEVLMSCNPEYHLEMTIQPWVRKHMYVTSEGDLALHPDTPLPEWRRADPDFYCACVFESALVQTFRLVHCVWRNLSQCLEIYSIWMTAVREIESKEKGEESQYVDDACVCFVPFLKKNVASHPHSFQLFFSRRCAHGRFYGDPAVGKSFKLLAVKTLIGTNWFFSDNNKSKKAGLGTGRDALDKLMCHNDEEPKLDNDEEALSNRKELMSSGVTKIVRCDWSANAQGGQNYDVKVTQNAAAYSILSCHNDYPTDKDSNSVKALRDRSIDIRGHNDIKYTVAAGTKSSKLFGRVPATCEDETAKKNNKTPSEKAEDARMLERWNNNTMRTAVIELYLASVGAKVNEKAFHHFYNSMTTYLADQGVLLKQTGSERFRANLIKMMRMYQVQIAIMITFDVPNAHTGKKLAFRANNFSCVIPRLVGTMDVAAKIFQYCCQAKLGLNFDLNMMHSLLLALHKNKTDDERDALRQYRDENADEDDDASHYLWRAFASTPSADANKMCKKLRIYWQSCCLNAVSQETISSNFLDLKSMVTCWREYECVAQGEGFELPAANDTTGNTEAFCFPDITDDEERSHLPYIFKKSDGAPNLRKKDVLTVYEFTNGNKRYLIYKVHWALFLNLLEDQKTTAFMNANYDVDHDDCDMSPEKSPSVSRMFRNSADST